MPQKAANCQKRSGSATSVLVTSDFAYSALSIRNAKSNCNVVSDKSRSYLQCFEDMAFRKGLGQKAEVSALYSIDK